MSDNMLVPRLLPELIQHVLECGNLNQKDLSLISTASRLFRDEAQRALFRDPGHFFVGLVVGDMLRTEAFFNAIISSPERLALMVRTHTQTAIWYDYSGDGLPSRELPQEAMFEKMIKAFKLMDNVKRFYSVDRAYNGHFRDRMLHSLSQVFPKLEEFLWHHNGGEQGIIEFLINRHRMRYLELGNAFDLGSYDHPHREQLLSAARIGCPKLEAISGPLETTKILIPGKSNIQYLRWTGRPPEGLKYEANKQHMLDEMGSLKYLVYRHPRSGIPFQITAPHLRELVFLRACSKILIKGDPKLFDHLLQLRAIDFYNDSYYGINTIPHDYLRRIFLGCKQLRYIDFELFELDFMKRSRYSVYRRFTRSPDTENSLRENLLADEGQDPEAAWDDRVALITCLTQDNTLHSVRCN